jgi:L-threonylcarbamoyladenylate synthase
VWGIGCDATNKEAVQRVFEIKHRPDSKAMLILTDSLDKVKRVSGELSSEAEALLLSTDRPTTVIVAGAHDLAPQLIAEDGSVGVRITSEAFSAELCRMAGVPIVSTSANISGEPGAPTYKDISQKIIDSVDYVCTTRRNDTTAAAPSRIVKIEADGSITCIRS